MQKKNKALYPRILMRGYRGISEFPQGNRSRGFGHPSTVKVNRLTLPYKESLYFNTRSGSIRAAKD
ncbi:MAG: hypothetical protein QXO76_03905 [Thermoproteota archaeon]